VRLGKGEVIYLRNASETLASYLRRLSKLGEVKIITKPSTLPVLFRGSIKLICLPPLTVISETPAEDSGTLPSMTVADECWAECKAVSLPSILKAAEALAENTPSLVTIEYSGSVEYRIVDTSLGKYVESYLNARHVAFLPNLREVVVRELTARPWYLWSNHPVVYGIRELIRSGSVPEEWECRCLGIEPPRKLLMLSKPLLYLGDNVLIAEIPFNASLALACIPSDRKLREELIVRSLTYVC